MSTAIPKSSSNKSSKSVIIVGASSGIGEALAEQLASEGCQLGLLARRLDRLEALAEHLRQDHGITVVCAGIDVSQQSAVADVLEKLTTELGGVDVVVVNAGISGFRKAGDGRIHIDRQVIETNLLGAMATIDAAVAISLKQGKGHIVGISSLTAVRGMPGIAAYTASKAALSNYLEGIRTEVQQKGISVTVVHPGFVATEFAPNMDKYPFVATPVQVAKEISRAIRQRSRSVTVPRWPWAVVSPVLRWLPDSVVRRIF